MTLRLILVFLLLTLSVLFLYFLLIGNFNNREVSLDLDADLATQEQYWIDAINDWGPKEAYSAFAALVSDVTSSRQHTLAHVMGGALYETMGTEGLSYCTDEYSYGCYHEFLGQAIQEGGIPVIEALSSSCELILKSQSLGCQHGIGHGILGYFGYDFDALEDALSTCESLGTETISRSCFGGVFMEYNTQTLLSDQARTRSFEPALGYMYPCSSLAGEWWAPCYFWQIQWWLALEHQEHPELSMLVDKMAERCAMIQNDYVKRECFRGIGYNLPGEAGYDAAVIGALCQRIAYEIGVVECSAGAAGSLLAHPGSASVGYTVCDGLSESDMAYCIRTANDPH